MKALGLSISALFFAMLAAPEAEAHFRAVVRPLAHLGPTHDGFRSAEYRRYRRGANGDLFITPDTPYDTATGGGPQFFPMPAPVGEPYPAEPWKPSQPRLILIGGAAHAQPHGKLPNVVYGDPLPAETPARP